jgi:hypothetical protein
MKRTASDAADDAQQAGSCSQPSNESSEKLLGLLTLASAATPESKRKSHRNAGKILHYNRKTGEHVYFNLGQVDREDAADWIPKGQEGYVTQRKARRKHVETLVAHEEAVPPVVPPVEPPPVVESTDATPTKPVPLQLALERDDFEHCQAAKVYMDIISNEFEQHEPEQALAFIFNAVQNYGKRFKNDWKPRESYVQLFGL